MSTGKRAYDLLRGYVHTEWERIKGVERSDAERELDAATAAAKASGGSPASVHQAVSESRKQRACRLLGVAPDATFEQVRKQYERLSGRSEPSKFPEGSAARAEAAEIQKSATWAYQVLSEDVDSTEKRFRTLEIEP